MGQIHEVGDHSILLYERYNWIHFDCALLGQIMGRNGHNSFRVKNSNARFERFWKILNLKILDNYFSLIRLISTLVCLYAANMFKNFQQSRILEDDFDNKLNCARFNALTVTSIFSFLILCVQDGGRDVDFGFSATLRVPLMFHTLILFHWNKKKVDAPAFSLKKAKLSVLNWIWGLQHRINWKFAAVQILIFIREAAVANLSFKFYFIYNSERAQKWRSTADLLRLGRRCLIFLILFACFKRSLSHLSDMLRFTLHCALKNLHH